MCWLRCGHNKNSNEPEQLKSEGTYKILNNKQQRGGGLSANRWKAFAL